MLSVMSSEKLDKSGDICQSSEITIKPSDGEWTMLDELRRVASWPLRSLGLDSGRALANAQPTPAVRQAQRLEQWVYVRAGFEARSATSTSHAS
jgi:hypothetical protein